MDEHGYKGLKISDMASFCGLTSQGLRYLEQRGLVSPVRDGEAGYRYYDLFEVGRIQRVKFFRDLGFSVEETRELTNSNDIEICTEMLGRRQAELAAEIKRERGIISLIGKRTAIISSLPSRLNTVAECPLPAYYQLTFAYLDTCTLKGEDMELLARWHSLSPIVHSMPYYPWSNGSWVPLNSSLGVFVDDILDCGMDLESFKSDAVIDHPSCPALCSFISVGHDLAEKEFEQPSNTPFGVFDDYLASHELLPCGDLLLNPIATMDVEGEPHSVFQALMPFTHA